MSEQNGYWSRERTAAEIARLNAILRDPGPIGKLTARRLKIEARYFASRAAEVVHWFWHRGSGPTNAMAGGV